MHNGSTELARWLFDPGSLTRRLRQHCPRRFRVQVLWQGWSRPSRDEARALHLRPEARAWTREVHLFCGDQPWVFARTVIPATTVRRCARRLTQLGNRPLGEVLFADPHIRRGPVEIARITPDQRLYQRALMNISLSPEVLWGRRSLFYLHNQILLVCEIFLPNLPASSPSLPFAHRRPCHHEH